MLILAIDTSWKHGSLALARGDAESFELLETVSLTGGAFSSELVPQIAAALARRSLRKQEIDGFAAVSGPGSFTGLRVGLAAIKGLVEVLKKPITTVSVLEALAIASGMNGRVFAALDAQRREVFLGEYDVHSETLQATSLQPESLLTREAFLTELPARATVVTPDASLAGLALPAGTTLRQIERPGAAAIARIGLRKILAGQTVSVDALNANYVRRSDAEIFSAPARKP
ncbi:MAG TPA: tRNA (adenosine(37)-N6)-threonylcarbamoyltransferase complex dimerization subunit type 1 TsaB [Terriglobales bacterium]|nr:tRNA (adenosine(37)-N6)-threonylcarbamoyltransferase complex dimerization subunit type 1 TsaB [Terriglobales bacterium]